MFLPSIVPLLKSKILILLFVNMDDNLSWTSFTLLRKLSSFLPHFVKACTLLVVQIQPLLF